MKALSSALAALALAPLAVAAFALPAAASPAFDAFRKVCGDNHVDFTAIKAALAGPGWTATDVQPTNMEGVTPTEGVARAAKFGDTEVAIYGWVGMKGQFHLTACTAKVAGANLDALQGEARAWLGFAPETTANGKSTWRYGETAGARAPVLQAGYQAAAGAAGLFFLNVFSDQGQVVLDLLKIKS